MARKSKSMQRPFGHLGRVQFTVEGDAEFVDAMTLALDDAAKEAGRGMVAKMVPESMLGPEPCRGCGDH